MEVLNLPRKNRPRLHSDIFQLQLYWIFLLTWFLVEPIFQSNAFLFFLTKLLQTTTEIPHTQTTSFLFVNLAQHAPISEILSRF